MGNKAELGVRKGSWTEEEDTLLRNCIHKYGEGKWHLLPLRAGLKRCRKSCRLRWLNYLRPGLKRGNFQWDEVDLITRLHKLLGNRWSLIAGRLPGRTANDVKNFWNTHIDKKSSGGCGRGGGGCRRGGERENEAMTNTAAASSNIIRPRPRKLSKIITSRMSVPVIETSQLHNNESMVSFDGGNCSNDHQPRWSSQKQGDDECAHWWESLLEFAERGEDSVYFPTFSF